MTDRKNEEERREAETRKLFLKDAFKETIKEYLDEKTRVFGKWSLRSLGVALIVALFYFVLSVNGWQHLPSVPTANEIRR